jgi:hypothetical protein
MHRTLGTAFPLAAIAADRDPADLRGEVQTQLWLNQGPAAVPGRGTAEP